MGWLIKDALLKTEADGQSGFKERRPTYNQLW